MSILKQKKPAEIEAILEAGVSSEFWEIICAVLEESRDALQAYQDSDEFRELPAEQYKIENELLRAKRVYLDMLKRTPDNLRSWLTTPDNKVENFDPYLSTEKET